MPGPSLFRGGGGTHNALWAEDPKFKSLCLQLKQRFSYDR